MEGEIQGIYLHGPDATQAPDLQGFYAELGAHLRAQGLPEDNLTTDFLPIVLPVREGNEAEEAVEEGDPAADQLLAARREIHKKVFNLLVGSLKGLKRGGRSLWTNAFQPTPGHSDHNIDDQDVEELARYVRTFLHEADPHFNSLLADPEVGVFPSLAAMINLILQHGFPRDWFKFFKRMSANAKTQDGQPIALQSLDWDKDDVEGEDGEPAPRSQPEAGKVYRRDLMKNRLQLMQAAGLRIENDKLRHAIPKTSLFSQGLCNEFGKAAERAKLSVYQKASWLNRMLKAIFILKPWELAPASDVPSTQATDAARDAVLAMQEAKDTVAVETVVYQLENEGLLSCTQALDSLFNNLKTNFNAAANRCNCPQYQKARWLNVLLNALKAHSEKLSIEVITAVMGELVTDGGLFSRVQADEIKVFAEGIDEFCTKKLPAIVAKHK